MQSLLRIFKSAMLEDRFCSNYMCQEMSHFVYHVADSDGAYYSTDVFCVNCAKHLVANLPSELLPTQDEVETKVRAEVEAEFKVYAAKLAEDYEKAHAQLGELTKAQVIADTETVTEALPFEDEAEEEEQQKPVYRCLDCSAEFDTPQKLGAHKRKHQ